MPCASHDRTVARRRLAASDALRVMGTGLQLLKPMGSPSGLIGSEAAVRRSMVCCHALPVSNFVIMHLVHAETIQICRSNKHSTTPGL
ncbi:hypothetical protein PSP6_410052 [Paraburkholderia tropica]|nr:hypothetical protein PSP6_410052 [Paraburkholderia tropica]